MEIIKQVLKKTKDIQNALEVYANENSLKLKECDFSIKGIETYIKTTLDEEFKLLNENLKEIYSDKNKLINEHVHLQQYYKITLSKKKVSPVKLSYSIKRGDYSTHPKIIILPDSIIPYQSLKMKTLFLELFKEVNKIKAKHNILINIFDDTMVKNLKAFTKYLYAGKFTKPIRIPLFEGVGVDITRPSKLILWFEEKNIDQQLTEVEKEEVLVEYKKPIFGNNGFNSFGEIIDGGYSNNSDDLELEIDQKTIMIKEDKNKKLYIAKRKGFVHTSNNTLLIDNKLKMSKISRVQTALATQEENNIEVVVSQNDTTKDSVGAGVELTSETIHINGHVGANSIIEATNLQIDGATHQDSKQFAKFAKINRHKGTLRCNDAKIILLEGGEVHATTLNIEASLGGTIYAQDVTIGHVKHNLKIYASNSITIRLVSGEDNIFKINYKEVPIINSKISFIHKDIEDLKYDLEEATRHNASKVQSIKDKIKKYKKQLDDIKSSAYNAKITIQKPFHGLNKIIFELDNGDKIQYKTQPLEYQPFYLEYKDENIILHPVDEIFPLTTQTK